MRENIPTTGRDAAPAERGRRFALLVYAVMAFCVSACATVAPEKPRFFSIQGNGISGTTSDPDIMQFRFDPPTWDGGSNTYASRIATTVRFTAPYPTSIELEINGKRLTQAEPPLSRNYEYASRIENSGANPVTWNVDILTPYDVPYAEDQEGQVAYVLRIVNVSGTNRSQPLEIHYRQPRTYVPQILSGGSTSTTSTVPSSASRPAGPCAGGAQEKPFRICWRKFAESPYNAGTTACSYSEAVRLLSNSYPGFSSNAGAC